MKRKSYFAKQNSASPASHIAGCRAVVGLSARRLVGGWVRVGACALARAIAYAFKHTAVQLLPHKVWRVKQL